jgi:hypothetical protein
MKHILILIVGSGFAITGQAGTSSKSSPTTNNSVPCQAWSMVKENIETVEKNPYTAPVRPWLDDVKREAQEHLDNECNTDSSDADQN